MKAYALSPWRTLLPSTLMVLLLSSPVRSEIIVTTALDENDSPAGAQISLREALRDAAGGEQITFAAALHGKAIALTRGEMTVSGKTLSVSAPGGLVIEAREQSRIFHVETGAGLNLTGVTLQRGSAPGDGGHSECGNGEPD